VAPAAGEECLLIDPGVGVLDQLSEVLQEYRLRPASVLATHGHLDHVYSVTPVCGAYGVSVSIHTEDRHRLVDPLAGLGPELLAMLRQMVGVVNWKQPEDVVTVHDGQQLSIAGVQVGVLHAPGHTEGSVMFSLPGLPDGLGAETGLESTLLTGDVLFAGSIGRTDLPGGSSAAMTRSLRERVLPLADGTLVLPGHGPSTTIGRERASNPYLRQAAAQ
jgi:hydroxyacylglutathione hydrolase